MKPATMDLTMVKVVKLDVKETTPIIIASIEFLPLLNQFVHQFAGMDFELKMKFVMTVIQITFQNVTAHVLGSF